MRNENDVQRKEASRGTHTRDALVTSVVRIVGAACGEQTERVVLFGSYARKREQHDSDVDVLVIAKDGVTDASKRTMRKEIRKRLVRERFPLPVDLIVKTRKEYEREKAFAGSVAYDIARDGVAL